LGLTNTDARWRELQAERVPYAVSLTTAEKPSISLGLSLRFESPRLKLWVVELPPLVEPDRK
jgi:hypothetical protein